MILFARPRTTWCLKIGGVEVLLQEPRVWYVVGVFAELSVVLMMFESFRSWRAKNLRTDARSLKTGPRLGKIHLRQLSL
jgi:hypothetical protein